MFEDVNFEGSELGGFADNSQIDRNVMEKPGKKFFPSMPGSLTEKSS